MKERVHKMVNELISEKTKKDADQEMEEKTQKQISKQTETKVEEISLVKRLIAEFLGTYLLVFAGTGAVILDFITGDLGHLGVSLLFGIALLVAIYTFGHLSGAHINPAITVGFLIQKKINMLSAVSYIISQILGALAASWTLYRMFGNVTNLGATLPIGTTLQTFALEAILTYFLTIVILSSIYGNQGKTFTGIAAGSILFFGVFFGGPLTGGSLNPARSIGPAIISGATEGLWIYIAAPLTGAILAALISKFINE